MGGASVYTVVTWDAVLCLAFLFHFPLVYFHFVGVEQKFRLIFLPYIIFIFVFCTACNANHN